MGWKAFILTMIAVFLIFLLGLFLIYEYYDCYEARGNENSKTIALCFDDGPNPRILKDLLPLLQKHSAAATFFVIGSVAIANKELIKEMHDFGHEIENHSWGHENFKNLLAAKGPEAVKSSLIKTSDIIFQITGRKPVFFRPPFWVITSEIEQLAIPLGFKIMKLENPDINTLDYDDAAKHHSCEVLIERVKRIIAARERQGKFNHVLVFHELTISVEALQTLISYFQNQDYQFIRLDETLKESRYKI